MASWKGKPVDSPSESADSPAAATEEEPLDIDALINMSQEAVWLVQKRHLRQYFIALQKHVRSLSSSGTGTGIDTSTGHGSSLAAASQTAPQPQPQPQTEPLVITSRLLSLPPEIRRLILLHLLGRPFSSPARGPHPRSLQSPLCLTRSMPPAVLRTCRQLYTEGCAVLYSTQEIHANVDFDVWAHRRDRSFLTVGSTVRRAVRHLHVHVFLGNEKRLARPAKKESDARLEVVRKGARKLGKWLVGPDAQGRREGGGGVEGVEVVEGWRLSSLKISWQEPPQTYTWEQKKTVLDEFRTMRPLRVEAGEINWGLKYPGKKFRFVEEYLQELGQVRGGDRGGERSEAGPSSSAAGGQESYDAMDTET
ncbi:hypothetical protein BR93DRAFT_182943 [Coniochaeta sp. PMI_546]|nr:hypothetical protein BR93DRAFT_182943 [Coniochaeta sp. PMI_546]